MAAGPPANRSAIEPVASTAIAADTATTRARGDRAPHRVRHGHQQRQARPVGRRPAIHGRPPGASRAVQRQSGVRRPASHQRQRIGQRQTAAAHIADWLRYPDASAPAAANVPNAEATADADGGESDDDRPADRAIAAETVRSRALRRAASRAHSRVASRWREPATPRPPASRGPRFPAPCGERAETRRPPTVNRKPPLTASSTATTRVAAATRKQTIRRIN